MADATATARSGQVRPQRRAGTMSRGCWRLVVLLGLSWVALLLLGGTAHAAEEPAPAAQRDQALPLLGQVLSDVDTVTEALPVREVTGAAAKTLQGLNPRDVTIPEPVTEAAEATTVAASHAASHAGTRPTRLPVIDSLDAVTVVADSVRETATATTPSENVLAVKLPSLTETVAPIVSGAARQLDTTTRLIADKAELLTVPLALDRPVSGVLDSLAGTVDRTTDVLTSTAGAVTTAADTVVASLADALAPVLDAVTGPAGSISVSVGSGASTATATAPASDLGVGATGEMGTAGANPPAPAGEHVDVLHDTTTGGPSVPPPDATNDSTNVVAQPATDIVTTVPVPVSAAGSTTGNGGSAPSPSPDQTLVRVEESEPEFEVVVTKPIEGPTGPMPGTPSADPAFSPD